MELLLIIIFLFYYREQIAQKLDGVFEKRLEKKKELRAQKHKEKLLQKEKVWQGNYLPNLQKLTRSIPFTVDTGIGYTNDPDMAIALRLLHTQHKRTDTEDEILERAYGKEEYEDTK